MSTAGTAPLRDEIIKDDSSLIWTLSHVPVVSVPLFVSKNNMPFGIQIYSKKYNDYFLFEFLNYLRKKT